MYRHTCATLVSNELDLCAYVDFVIQPDISLSIGSLSPHRVASQASSSVLSTGGPAYSLSTQVCGWDTLFECLSSVIAHVQPCTKQCGNDLQDAAVLTDYARVSEAHWAAAQPLEIATAAEAALQNVGQVFHNSSAGIGRPATAARPQSAPAAAAGALYAPAAAVQPTGLQQLSIAAVAAADASPVAAAVPQPFVSSAAQVLVHNLKQFELPPTLGGGHSREDDMITPNIDTLPGPHGPYSGKHFAL